jgi:hypothetical protein
VTLVAGRRRSTQPEAEEPGDRPYKGCYDHDCDGHQKLCSVALVIAWTAEAEV